MLQRTLLEIDARVCIRLCNFYAIFWKGNYGGILELY